MNDFYAEYLVEKRSDGKDTAKRILLLVGMTVLCIVIFLFTGPVGILLSALVVYGGYYLFTGTSTEYEYIDRKSTRLNSSHIATSRMTSSA